VSGAEPRKDAVKCDNQPESQKLLMVGCLNAQSQELLFTLKHNPSVFHLRVTWNIQFIFT